MDYDNPDALVSTDWLAAHLNDPEVRIVDATFLLPGMGEASAEYAREHIPGAVFFDVDKIADTGSPLPHMLPDPVKFSSRMQGLGIGDGSMVVAYDRAGGTSGGARVWWMMRVFGHDRVALLDGGFTKWKAEGRPTESVAPIPRARHFHAILRSALVKSLPEIKDNLESAHAQTVDARPAARFAGAESEPRKVARQGHIPGSRNLPASAVIDPATKAFLPADVLAARFKAAGIDFRQPSVASCGSGVSACALALAAYLIGHKEMAVYDGSWAEWGNTENLPVELGNP